MLVASLVTLGSPEQPTGGYLYHRRMSELAPAHGARLELVSLPALPFPLPAAFGRRLLRRVRDSDVVVVDSIVAAYMAPWRPVPPVVAILHQPPGGIDHGPVRSAVQSLLDRACTAGAHAARPGGRGPGGHRPPVRAQYAVVPPGRDVAPQSARRPLDLRQGRRAALLCVGNWMARKGVLDLVEAFARCRPTWPRCTS